MSVLNIVRPADTDPHARADSLNGSRQAESLPNTHGGGVLRKEVISTR